MFSKDGIHICGSSSLQWDPHFYNRIRIPRFLEGIRARDSSVEETSKLGLESSPEQEFSEMLVLAMFLQLFENIAVFSIPPRHRVALAPGHGRMPCLKGFLPESGETKAAKI